VEIGAPDVWWNGKGEAIMNREALKQTIRVLEEVKARNLAFDLNTFVGYNRQAKDDRVAKNMPIYPKLAFDTTDEEDNLRQKWEKSFLSTDEGLLIPHNCGATACATGYAGLDPWFVAQGFYTTLQGNVKYKHPDGDFEVDGWEALETFYDIYDEESEWLFMPAASYTVTDPQVVIDRIQDVLDNGFPEFIGSYEQDDYDGDDD
jgi:hypothetical protein